MLAFSEALYGLCRSHPVRLFELAESLMRGTFQHHFVAFLNSSLLYETGKHLLSRILQLMEEKQKGSTFTLNGRFLQAFPISATISTHVNFR